jgi:hypothetical protein
VIIETVLTRARMRILSQPIRILERWFSPMLPSCFEGQARMQLRSKGIRVPKVIELRGTFCCCDENLLAEKRILDTVPAATNTISSKHPRTTITSALDPKRLGRADQKANTGASHVGRTPTPARSGGTGAGHSAADSLNY